MSLRIAFAATSYFAQPSLQALLHSSHTVTCVLTKPDRRSGRGLKQVPNTIKTLALSENIPILQPSKLDHETFDTLIAQQLDVLVVVAYGMIVPQEMLNIPRWGGVNVHSSVLPKWRGAAPVQRAILAGDTQTGVTIMQMDAGLDTGNILNIVHCPISNIDTTLTLRETLSQLGADTLLTTLTQIEQGTTTPKAQDNDLATYAHKLTKAHSHIRWQDSAEHIDCQIRAFTPWPGSFTALGTEPFKIWQAECLHAPTDRPPGTLLTLTPNHCTVATGDGQLALYSLQFNNKPRFTIRQAYQRLKQRFDAGDTQLGQTEHSI